MSLALEQLKTASARPAAVLSIRTWSSGEPLASNLQLRAVALPDEAWPLDDRGVPLLLLGQFNLTEAPFKSELLQDIALLTVFVSPSEVEGQRWIQDAMDGDQFAIRAYSTLEGLVPLAAPDHYPYAEWPGAELDWSMAIDYPTCEDPDRISPSDLGLPEADDEDDDPYCMCESNLAITKIGGYVTMCGYLQEFFYADEGPMFPVLQIMNHPELNITWGSMSGGVHVFRGSTPELRHLWKIHQEID